MRVLIRYLVLGLNFTTYHRVLEISAGFEFFYFIRVTDFSSCFSFSFTQKKLLQTCSNYVISCKVEMKEVVILRALQHEDEGC